jgi:hypothetical protein
MDVKKTITSIFMVPTLKIPKDALKDNGFINGYVVDGSREVQYEGCIYLLFQPKDLDKFREFLDSEYERTKSVIDDYDYQDGYVVVVYKLDPKFNKDFGLIREGLYSRTSSSFQALFPKVIKITKNGLHRDEISLQYRVFNRTEDLVKFWEDKLGVEFDDNQEVWHGFELDKETLNIQKLKELCTTTK